MQSCAHVLVLAVPELHICKPPPPPSSPYLVLLFCQDGMKVMQTSHEGYWEELIQCIEDGTPVLIENLPDSLDPLLDPLLSRSFIHKKGKSYLKFGDR